MLYNAIPYTIAHLDLLIKRDFVPSSKEMAIGGWLAVVLKLWKWRQDPDWFSARWWPKAVFQHHQCRQCEIPMGGSRTEPSNDFRFHAYNGWPRYVDLVPSLHRLVCRRQCSRSFFLSLYSWKFCRLCSCEIVCIVDLLLQSKRSSKSFSAWLSTTFPGSSSYNYTLLAGCPTNL